MFSNAADPEACEHVGFMRKYILKNVNCHNTMGQIHILLLELTILQCWLGNFFNSLSKVEKILKGSLDSIPSPSVKIQIIGGKVYLE